MRHRLLYPADLSKSKRARQGAIILRTRAEKLIFFAGIAAPVVLLLVLLLVS